MQNFLYASTLAQRLVNSSLIAKLVIEYVIKNILSAIDPYTGFSLLVQMEMAALTPHFSN